MNWLLASNCDCRRQTIALVVTGTEIQTCQPFITAQGEVPMTKQNYANHRRYVPMFHGVLFLLIVLTFGGALVNLFKSIGDEQRIYSASLIVVLSVIASLLFFFVRQFSAKVQDRAIRAEENLRHFALTGKLLDPRLTIRQIIGLRFASDEEFTPLVRRAAEENMSEDAIKQTIKNWRGDYDRV
jgi:hypothetical protein